MALSVVDIIGGAERDMIMDMTIIGMYGNDIGITDFKEPVGKLYTNLVCLLRRDFI